VTKKQLKSPLLQPVDQPSTLFQRFTNFRVPTLARLAFRLDGEQVKFLQSDFYGNFYHFDSETIFLHFQRGQVN